MAQNPKEKPHWPGWFYGPDGAAEIFQCREDVPAGWEDHPSKVLSTAETEIAEITDDKVISEPPKPKRPYRRKAK